MKIITVCGSLKFRDEIMKITEEMTLQGNCMLSIVYPTNSDIAVYTGEERELLGNMHKERKGYVSPMQSLLWILIIT